MKENKQVLLIDDSAVQREMQSMLLVERGLAEDRINGAGDGREALALLESRVYQLIVVDWNMPNMNGLEFLRTLRKTNQETPVVMVTSESEQDRYLEAMEAGASAFLNKPLHEEEYWATIEPFLV